MLTHSLYRGIFITSAFLDRVRDKEDFAKLSYIEVLFHTFYCNFGRAEENRSLYRGLRYMAFVKSRFHDTRKTNLGE